MRKFILILAMVALLAQLAYPLGHGEVVQGSTEIIVVNLESGDENFAFYTNDTTAGSRFNATVYVYEVTGLFAYQVCLTVNDTLLNITRAWVPVWDEDWIFYEHLNIPATNLDDVDGDGLNERVKAGSTLFNVDNSAGNGTLAVIEFEIVYAPTHKSISCNLDIDNEDTYLLDNNFDEIAASKTSGYYQFVDVSTSEEAYLVVRGLNDRIYYRLHNSTSDTWEDWSVVPTGVTCDSPAATVRNGKLYIVVRGIDGRSLWFAWINLTTSSFSGWSRISGATVSTPTLVDGGSQLVLLVRGSNNRIYYQSYDCISDVWEGWNVLPTGATCDSPKATILGDEMHIIVRGISRTSEYANYSLWHSRLNLSDSSFSGWTQLTGLTPSAPTLATLENLGRIYLTVRGLNNRIYYNIRNGTEWKGWTGLPTGATSKSPASTIIDDTFHFAVQSEQGTSLWHYYIDLVLDDHSGWRRISGASQSAPTLCG